MIRWCVMGPEAGRLAAAAALAVVVATAGALVAVGATGGAAPFLDAETLQLPGDALDLLDSLGDLLRPELHDVVMNEIEQNWEGVDTSDPNDWVEIYNRGNHAVRVQGWYVLACNAHEGDTESTWERSHAVTQELLQPGEHLVVHGDGNWLQRDVERIYLIAVLDGGREFIADAAFVMGDGCRNPYGWKFRDRNANDARTWQRVPDGGCGRWYFLTGTEGVANEAPFGVPWVISRVVTSEPSSDRRVNEYVELTNISRETLVRVDSHIGIYGAQESFQLPQVSLRAGEVLRVYSGDVPQGSSGVSIGQDGPLWSGTVPDRLEVTHLGRWGLVESSYWTQYALALLWLQINWDAVPDM